MTEPGPEPQQRPPSEPQRSANGAQLPPVSILPSSARRRRKVLLFAGIGLVLVLVAGLITWLAWPKPARNRAPFEQALAGLAEAEGVHYTDKSITQQKRDITTTQFGEQFGVTGYQGLEKDDQGVLRVGGKIYTKFQRETGKLGEWKTGDPNDNYMYGDLIKAFPPPRDLSAKLSSALADLPDLPAPTDPDLPALTIGGVPALRADTSAGTLYVAKDAPYRVLRLEPQGLLSPSRLHSLTALPSLPALPTQQVGPGSVGADSEGMDVSPIDDDQADQMYDTLAENTKGLSDAVDAEINFSLTAAGTFNCSAAGCNVLESFTGTLSTDARTRITSGQVTAKLTVTNVAIDGRPAGGCVSPPSTIPITGNTASGQLSCDDPEAGPVFAAVDAEYQAKAQQQANATGGTVTLRYSATGDAEVNAEAVGQAEVDQLLNQQKQERDPAVCQTPNSFAPGTRVLLADGSTRPIEQVTPGVQVRATDPATGRTTAEPVLARITGTGQKQLDQLAITDGQHTATVTATAGHPFWDPVQRAWVAAGDLRPGTALASLPGSDPVHVTGNRAYQAPLTVHNLAIAHTHTYYVLAGDTPVLVHNTTPCPQISTRISAQRQARHVRGDPLYNGGGYFNNAAEAQKVLDALHANQATVLGAKSNGNIVVRYSGVTGYNNNLGAKFFDQPTNVFMIKGAKSPSVVPIDPNWTP